MNERKHHLWATTSPETTRTLDTQLTRQSLARPFNANMLQNGLARIAAEEVVVDSERAFVLAIANSLDDAQRSVADTVVGGGHGTIARGNVVGRVGTVEHGRDDDDLVCVWATESYLLVLTPLDEVQRLYKVCGHNSVRCVSRI